MPEKWHEITIKVVSAPYVAGNDAYVDVVIFGNPQKWTFRMKLGKTLWFSILKHLQELDNSRFSEKLEPSVLQKNLEFLNGRIITIRGVKDENVSFKTKEGGLEFAKKFIVKFRGDLEEAVTLGGEFYKKAVFATVLDNLSGVDCIVANSNLAKFEIEKEKEKETLKEEKERLKEEKKKKTRVEKKSVKKVEKKAVGLKTLDAGW